MSPSNYHEEAWEDDRIKRADWYENVPNPQQSNMFVRYLLTITSEARVAINRQSWRDWHASHNCTLAHR